MKQNTQEWHNARIGRLTASRAGAALGLNPYQSPDDLIRAMVREAKGAEPDFTGNIATQWGKDHEPLAVLDYMGETGADINACALVVHPDINWLAASPDALVGDDGMVEIKCPFGLRNGGKFKSINEQPHYYAQVQVQIACTGREWCDFYQWAPHATKTERVLFDYAWWQKHEPGLRQFYQRYLRELDNPEHLTERTQKIEGERYQKMLDRYDDLARVQDEAKAEQKEILDTLVDAAGGQSAEVCGRKLTRVERRGSVAYSKLVKDLMPDADLEAYRGDDSVHWRLS